MTPRRILIQHPHKPNEISGVTTYVDVLADALNDLGHATQTISSSQSSLRARFAAVRSSEIVHLNSNDLWMLAVSKILRKRVVLKLHYLTYQSLHFAYTPMAFAERIGAEIRFLWATYGKTKRRRVFFEATARLALRVAVMLSVDHVAACSNFLAESTGLKRVSTIYNPAGPTRDYVAPATTRPPAICFVGRLSRDKGCDLLLEAVASIRLVDSPVLIAGVGEEMRALRDQAAALGLKNVEFLGQLSASEVSDLLRSALVLVVPSRWQEPAGYTPVEASLNECPSIASRVGGLPETAGPHSLYFERESVAELARWLTFAVENRAAMREIGASSKKYAERKFAPLVIAGEFLQAADVR